MKKNIIILTSGLSGSSVVAHLLSLAGYWVGDSTCMKSDYNTYENEQLVYLNEKLLAYIDYTDYSVYFDKFKLEAIEALYSTIDLGEFYEFITTCQQYDLWLWKDPRLWVTLPFWMNFLDKNDFQVMIVDRKISQRWISELLRRNIQSFKYCENYNLKISKAIDNYIVQYGLESKKIVFDALIKRPENILKRINTAIGSSLKLDDLKAVYNKPLYRKIRGLDSLFMAVLIYLKNYRVALISEKLGRRL